MIKMKAYLQKKQYVRLIQEVYMPYIGLALVICNVVLFLYHYMQ